MLKVTWIVCSRCAKATVFMFLLLCLIACGNQRRPALTERISLTRSDGADGTWRYMGFNNGAHIPDVTLFTAAGRPFNILSRLSETKKPLVLINASYTCDLSRANLPAIKRITNRYDSAIDFVMVYTIEPHPIDTVGPYDQDTVVRATPNNLRDHIEAAQPRTYGERVELSRRWTEEMEITSPVVVDNPDNEYWVHFGQAPNMVYVLQPDGTVYLKQTFFNESQLDHNLQNLLAE